jgi:hypothetical protein
VPVAVFVDVKVPFSVNEMITGGKPVWLRLKVLPVIRLGVVKMIPDTTETLHPAPEAVKPIVKLVNALLTIVNVTVRFWDVVPVQLPL